MFSNNNSNSNSKDDYFPHVYSINNSISAVGSNQKINKSSFHNKL